MTRHPERIVCVRSILGPILTTGGVLTIISGITFILQSAGYLGPESSFMVRNADWTGYGLLVTLVGVLITVAGRALQR
jgi:hypothetical protein